MTSTITNDIDDQRIIISPTEPIPKPNEQVLWIKPEADSFGLYIVTGE
jgi:hypothetical protein